MKLRVMVWIRVMTRLRHSWMLSSQGMSKKCTYLWVSSVQCKVLTRSCNRVWANSSRRLNRKVMKFAWGGGTTRSIWKAEEDDHLFILSTFFKDDCQTRVIVHAPLHGLGAVLTQCQNGEWRVDVGKSRPQHWLSGLRTNDVIKILAMCAGEGFRSLIDASAPNLSTICKNYPQTWSMWKYTVMLSVMAMRLEFPAQWVLKRWPGAPRF